MINEGDADRVKALRDYQILDTPAEEIFENITRLAVQVLQTPIALVSLVDAERQWFKSRVGLEVDQTPREYSFCSHAIQSQTPLLVPDAQLDPRFANNPLVTGDPHIRFYCGVPLRTPQGYGLGSLCVIDRQPRTFSPGEIKTLEMLARQVEMELEIRRQLWMLRDALEGYRQNELPKEVIAAMLVHDLRSPLTSLTLLASFVKTDDPESIEALEELFAEAERMRVMLKDVLDICLHQVGKMGARRRDLELQPFVQGVARRLARLGKVRDQRLLLELPEAPVTVNADPDLLERLLENLVINAIDHGPAGKPISLSLRVTDQGRVQGEVRDHGQPIPEASRTKLFDLFQRLGVAGKSREWGGRGLGLTFCRLAVEAHGGTITVSPSSEGGNSFRFEFPG